MYIYNYNASDLKFTLAPCIAFFLGRPISESWLGHDFWPWQYTHVYSCNITCSRSINSFGGSIVVGYHNSWTVYQGNSYWNGRFRGIPIQETPTQILGKATFWHRTDHYIQLVSYQSWCLPLYLPSGLLFQVCKILFHPYPEPPEQWNIGLIPTLDKGNSRL